jgi:Cof subfamily protein (haloacid dehalogenase superfamily)
MAEVIIRDACERDYEDTHRLSLPDIKMIVTDLDNTLLTSEAGISPRTTAVFSRCRELGILVVYATARPERVTVRFQELVKPDYIISNHGAIVSGKDIILLRHALSKETTAALIHSLLALHPRILSIEIGEDMLTTSEGPEWEGGWNNRPCSFDPVPPVETLKCVAYYDDEIDFSPLCQELPDIRIIFDSKSYIKQGTCYHFVAKEVTKMNAVRHLARHLGIDPANIVAFGDDDTDADMLQGCGIGIAVANATAPIQAVADAVCASNDADGVAQWLEANVL